MNTEAKPQKLGESEADAVALDSLVSSNDSIDKACIALDEFLLEEGVSLDSGVEE
ncbi:hypothetical protein ACYPKM_03415 [Pseudomonas aeruginosa]